MGRNITADEIYILFRNALKEKDAPDEFYYRAIDKICGEKNGIGLSKEGIEALKEEFLQFKKHRDIETFIRKVFEIGNRENILMEQYEDVKAVVELREKIQPTGFKAVEKVIEEVSPKKDEEEEPKSVPEEVIKPEERKVQPDTRKKPATPVFNRYGTPKQEPKAHKPEPQKSVKKMESKKYITSENLQTDEQKNLLIEYLCLNGIAIDELSINNVPVKMIEQDPQYADLDAIVNVIKAKIRVLLSLSASKGARGENTKNVLNYVLCERNFEKALIRDKEENVIRVNNRAPQRFTRIMLDCFQNSSGDIDSCSMVFILERLKRRGYDFTKNNVTYNGHKIKTQKEIESLIQEMTIKKGKSFTQ